MTVTETMPPDPNMLKFLLERRMPDNYREIKEVQHTLNAGALFQAFLKRMDDRAKSEPVMIEAKPIIDVDVSPVLAQNPKPVDNYVSASDRVIRRWRRGMISFLSIRLGSEYSKKGGPLFSPPANDNEPNSV